MELPKINLNDPSTFRTLVIGGLSIIFILVLISNLLFPPVQPDVPADFDVDAQLNVIPYTNNKVIIEVTDERVTDPEVLRQLAGISDDVEIIVDIPGATQKDNFEENPFYYFYESEDGLNDYYREYPEEIGN